MKRYVLTAAGCCAAFAANPAAATIIMVDASSIQGSNLLFGTEHSGTSVTGTLNDAAGTEVVFTSGGATLIGGGGQANVTGGLDLSTNSPVDTLLLNALDFELVSGGTFNDLEFNIFGGTATSVSFSLTDDAGQVFSSFGGQSSFTLGNGENFFGFQGIDGQSIRNVELTFSGGGVLDVRQVRLDAGSAPIPEPATWAMMIGGLGLVGAAARRRKPSRRVPA